MAGWTDIDERGLSSVPGVDPAVEWALGEGADYFFPSDDQQLWVPILVQLKQDVGEKEFESGSLLRVKDWSDFVRLSSAQAKSFTDSRTRFISAFVKRTFFNRLWDLWKDEEFRTLYEKYVARITIGLPLDDDSMPLTQDDKTK